MMFHDPFHFMRYTRHGYKNYAIFFKKYVEYDFTADLENQLDIVSQGEMDYKDLLRNFWGPFKEQISVAANYDPIEGQKLMTNDLLHYLFKNEEDQKCGKCESGYLILKVSNTYQ